MNNIENNDNMLNEALDLYNQGKLKKSEELLKEVLDIDNCNIKALFTLGLINFTLKEYSIAFKHIKKSYDISNDHKIKIQLGVVQHRLGRYKEAQKIYEEILDKEPDNISILNNLCAIKLLFGKLSEAKDLAKKTISIKPSYIDPYINLGNILKDSGNINEAIEVYEKALTIDPQNKVALSNLLLAIHYSTKSNDYIYNKHLEWDNTQNDLNENYNISIKQKINIGYISGDFRKHSVSYFIEPILANHDKNIFNIFCYSDVINPDPVTIKLKHYSDTWRPIYKLNNKELRTIIKKDNIDILIDLSGHTASTRLELFAHRSAPIQITYCGYPDTTGLSNMDYRITDNIADPEGSDKFYTEKLIRMKKCFLCYRPAKDTPKIIPTPAIENGYITFGSFNHLSKLSDETIELWSKLLIKNKNFHLILKAKQFTDEKVKDTIINKFVKHGVAFNNIKLISHVSGHKEHLACYNQIDIALDPFPYNGTTTTCEALWMGVPVISLYGYNHAGRVGGSLLTNIGLKSLVTKDEESFIKTALFLSDDINRLNSLRMGLRQTLINSPLCDAKNFANELEEVFKSLIKERIS